MVWNNVENNSESQIYFLFENNNIAQELASQARNYGYKARVMNSIGVFENVCKSYSPQVVVAELKIFKEKSFSAVISAAQGFSDHKIFTLLIGENGSLSSRLNAVREGADSFLFKPVNIMAMLNQLNLHCDHNKKEVDRVMLLSDGSELPRQTVSQLDSLGLQAGVVENSAEILSSIDLFKPDMLIINGDMPTISAVDLVQVLRQDDQFFGLPIAVITKRDKRIFDQQAISSGIDTLIGLPIPSSDLAAICKSKIKRADNLKREFRYLSKRDAVTGLYNKEYFFEKLNQAISHNQAGSASGAVVYIHLEEMENSDKSAVTRIFDITVGNILRSKVSPPHVPAYIDNHVFVILYYSDDERVLDSYVESIRQAIEKVEYLDQGTKLTAKYSVGVTLLGSKVSDALGAVKRAEESCAINEANKESESNREETVKLSREIIEKWTEAIKSALMEDRFRLVYQPIANLSGHPESFYEVFLRMQDETGADILPQEFLPVAEHSNVSSKIDRWVIDHAIHVISENNSLGHKPILFIKLFPSSIEDRDLIFFIEQRIFESGLEGNRFVFQITQSSASLRLQDAWELTSGLKKLGCQIAVEHYGKDRDSLHIIKKLPVDYVKIDGSLVVDINSNEENQQRIEAIAREASENHAMTIASLVQDASSLAALYRCGVDYIQGYFMQEPADVFSASETL